MKTDYRLPLGILSLCFTLPLASGQREKAEALADDYLDGVFQMCQYQDETENYFLGNSLFELKPNTFALHNSICLNPTDTKHLTIVLEFEESLFPTAAEITLSATFADAKDPSQKKTWTHTYDSDMGVSFDQLPDCDYYLYDNILYLEYDLSGFSDPFVINGIDREEYFYVQIESETDHRLVRFMMNDHSGCDTYYQDYVFQPHTIGSFVNSSKVYYGGETYCFRSNISNPYPLDEIVGNIKAFDYGDNASVDITYSDRNYLEAIANKTLGECAVDLFAEDSFGNRSTLTLKILLVDITKPIINIRSGDARIRIPVSRCGEIGAAVDLNEYVDITDDYDETLSLLPENQSIAFFGLGSKNVILRARDSSGNLAEQTFTVEFYDDVAPTIQGDFDEIDVYPYQYKSANEILNRFFTISDNHLISEKGIKDDDFTMNFAKTGTYTFTIYAVDFSGNTSEKTITVHVRDSEGPVFFIDEVYLTLESNSAYLSAKEMVRQLMDTKQIESKNYAIVEYANTKYNENYQNPGTYDVVIACYDENFNKSYINVRLTVRKNAGSSVGFLAGIDRFFVKVFRSIKDFFLWIGKQIGNLFR